VITENPLMPQRYNLMGKIETVVAGLFTNSELCAEYFCFVFVFALIFAGYNKGIAALQINKVFPSLALIISLSMLVLSTSRAAMLLSAAAAFGIILVNLITVPSFKGLLRIFSFLIILFIVGGSTLLLSDFIGLDRVKDKFALLKPTKMNTQTIISGKETNRFTAFEAGFRRLDSKSWWIGYGYTLPENNMKSMGFNKHDIIKDYHSLYLSLPIFYGWIGAASYLLLILITEGRIVTNYLTAKRFDHFIVPVAFGFSICWVIFLLNEYKISVTRNPQYFLLIWLLLGLTHSVANSIGINNKTTTESHK
jgi:hypothetical protein